MFKRSGLFLKRTGVLILAVIAVAALSAKSRDAKNASLSAPARSASPSSLEILAAQSDQQPIQGLVIALRPNGFIPPEVDITDGNYIIAEMVKAFITSLEYRNRFGP